MTEGDLITLEDNERYVLLMEFYGEESKRKYFLATKIEGKKMDFKQSCFFRAITENGEEYLEDVNDVNEIAQLINLVAIRDIMEKYPELDNEIINKIKEEEE